MTGNIRCYKPSDYDAVIALYQQSEIFGGQFDEARDSSEKLNTVTKKDPQSILVYEEDGNILGTVSLIEDGRVAWLFRFAAQDDAVAQDLYQKGILSGRGHAQILVYSDPNNQTLNQRYTGLGMNEGDVYRCFWQEVSLPA